MKNKRKRVSSLVGEPQRFSKFNHIDCRIKSSKKNPSRFLVDKKGCIGVSGATYYLSDLISGEYVTVFIDSDKQLIAYTDNCKSIGYVLIPTCELMKSASRTLIISSLSVITGVGVSFSEIST